MRTRAVARPPSMAMSAGKESSAPTADSEGSWMTGASTETWPVTPDTATTSALARACREGTSMVTARAVACTSRSETSLPERSTRALSSEPSTWRTPVAFPWTRASPFATARSRTPKVTWPLPVFSRSSPSRRPLAVALPETTRISGGIGRRERQYASESVSAPSTSTA